MDDQPQSLWKTGRMLEESQRVNVNDENDTENNQYRKLVLITEFVDRASEVSYQQNSQQYTFDLPNDRVDNEIENLLDLNEEQSQTYKNFINQNKSHTQVYATLMDYKQSEDFLNQHVNLINENASKYLMGWSIYFAMDDDFIGMHRVTNQLIIIDCIRQLMKDTKDDAIQSVTHFFRQLTYEQYKEKFDENVCDFRQRVYKHARHEIEKIQVDDSLPKKLEERDELNDVVQLQGEEHYREEQ